MPFVNKKRLLKEKKKTKEKYNTELINLDSDNNINKLIPNIKKLSTKYMINEYNLGKNKIKNMSQFDFILFDNFFVSQGKRKYSKDPLISVSWYIGYILYLFFNFLMDLLNKIYNRVLV